MGKADQIRKIKEINDNGQTAFQQNNTLDILLGGTTKPAPEAKLPYRSTQVVGNATKTSNITLRLEPYLFEEIKTLASIEQRSINTMIAVAIKNYVMQDESQRKIDMFRRLKD